MSPYRLYMVSGDYIGGRTTLFLRDWQEAKKRSEDFRRDGKYTNVRVFVATTEWERV